MSLFDPGQGKIGLLGMLHRRAELFQYLSAEFIELSMSPNFVCGARRGRFAENSIMARRIAKHIFPKGAMLLFVRSVVLCEGTK